MSKNEKSKQLLTTLLLVTPSYYLILGTPPGFPILVPSSWLPLSRPLLDFFPGYTILATILMDIVLLATHFYYPPPDYPPPGYSLPGYPPSG
uniref:Uncharacterized protein n=1 Tax=Ditylenchus dipsaci TaxID=166011 RepID=A0A915DCJ6_9BILA